MVLCVQGILASEKPYDLASFLTLAFACRLSLSLCACRPVSDQQQQSTSVLLQGMSDIALEVRS